MRYNLLNKDEVKSAQDHLTKLIESKEVVEIIKKSNKTVSQNSYLHLVLSICALACGENLEGFKNLIFKRYINKDLFETTYENKKTGEVRKHWKSVADLTKDETKTAIDKLIKFAVIELQISIPECSDFHNLNKMRNEIEVNAKYL